MLLTSSDNINPVRSLPGLAKLTVLPIPQKARPEVTEVASRGQQKAMEPWASASLSTLSLTLGLCPLSRIPQTLAQLCRRVSVLMSHTYPNPNCTLSPPSEPPQVIAGTHELQSMPPPTPQRAA